MLGHKLVQVLSHRFHVFGTVRGSAATYTDHPVFRRASLVSGVRALDLDSVVHALAIARPTVAINGIGIVKQLPAAKDPLLSIAINALFPHRLARLCQAAGVRLIHFSTDCVFSGREGKYVEDDVADAEDLYGRTKFLGEVSYDNSVTLRTSIIGRELKTSHGLVEWFLSQRDKTVRGYRRAIFSGFTTCALAELVAQIIDRYPEVQGVWHVASGPISKFDLLSLLNQAYGLNIQIEPHERVVCDRSLNGDRFRRATGYSAPCWREMIEQMVQDDAPYSEIRRSCVY